MMTQKLNHAGRVALTSSLTLCLIWVSAALAGMLSLQGSDSAPLLEFLRFSRHALAFGGALSVSCAVYLAFRHAWQAMAIAISLSVVLGASACIISYAGV